MCGVAGQRKRLGIVSIPWARLMAAEDGGSEMEATVPGTGSSKSFNILTPFLYLLLHMSHAAWKSIVRIHASVTTRPGDGILR